MHKLLVSSVHSIESSFIHNVSMCARDYFPAKKGELLKNAICTSMAQ